MKKTFLTYGICDSLIVIPEKATAVEQTAAEEVRSYIERSM